MSKIMRNGNKYGGTASSMAKDIIYDNTESGLNSDNIQDVVNELHATLSSLSTDLEQFYEDFKSVTTEHKTFSGSKSYGTLWGEHRGTVDTTIVFEKPFIETPTVTVSGCSAGGSCSTSALSVTPSGFILRHTYHGYNDGVSHSVSWTAQGYVSKI